MSPDNHATDLDILALEVCRLRSERDVALLERDRMAQVAVVGVLGALFAGVLLLCEVLT